MSRRHVTTHRHLLSSVSAALFVLSAGVTAQRFLPSLDPAVVPEKLKNFVPVTDDMLLRPKPENWITFRNGYNLWGYSSLNQINAGNVRQLRLAWSRAMQSGPQEVEPLVYDGIMFLVNSEDILQALDATNGDLLWEYKRKLPPNIGSLTGTQFRYRNVSIYDDKIFLAHERRLPDRPRGKVWKGALGNPASELQRSSRSDDRSDSRQGQAHQRLTLQSSKPASGRVFHHRA